MKKAQRIFALLGVILLVLLYVSTLIFAFLDSSASMGLFKISIAGTIFIPVILYAMTIFHNLFSKDRSDSSNHIDEEV